MKTITLYEENDLKLLESVLYNYVTGSNSLSTRWRLPVYLHAFKLEDYVRFTEQLKADSHRDELGTLKGHLNSMIKHWMKCIINYEDSIKAEQNKIHSTGRILKLIEDASTLKEAFEIVLLENNIEPNSNAR
jgi:hypothetical protein